MTEKEQYNLLLCELANLVKEKNDLISLQRFQIQQLEERLMEAEKGAQEAHE